MNKTVATLSIERELNDKLLVIEYEEGNGDVHFHDAVEICIVEDGEIEAFVNNAKRTLASGDIAIALPYDSHSYVSCCKSKYCVLVLPPEMSDKFAAILKSGNSPTPFIIDSSNKSAILENLSKIKKKKENELLSLGYAYLILGLIANGTYAPIPSEDVGTELLSRLLLYIHDNHDKSLTLNSISTAFGYHPAYISSYFKSRLDMCISRYINIIRLKNAVLLMRQNGHNLTQIAYDCGFNSTRTFYRAFDKEFGCSPREYIKKMKS